MTDKLLSEWPGVLAEDKVPHDSDLSCIASNATSHYGRLYERCFQKQAAI